MSTYSVNSRFRVESQQWESYCDHPKCEVLHRNRSRFRWVSLPTGDYHEVTRTEWIIVDKVTNERAHHGQLSAAFDTRRDAVHALDVFGVSALRDLEESEARMASRAALPTRFAKVSGRSVTATTVRAYLPSNYEVTNTYHDGSVLISGADHMGWTLDGYVIPRLASGGYVANEVDAASCDDCGGTGSVPASASSMVDGTDDDGHDACPSCVKDYGPAYANKVS